MLNNFYETRNYYSQLGLFLAARLPFPPSKWPKEVLCIKRICTRYELITFKAIIVHNIVDLFSKCHECTYTGTPNSTHFSRSTFRGLA